MMKNCFKKTFLTKENKKKSIDVSAKGKSLIQVKINRVVYFSPAILSGRGKRFMQVVW